MNDRTEVQETAPEQTETVGSKFAKEVLDWTVSIAVAIVIAFLIRSYIFTMVKVDGQSMEPTLSHGDTLFTRIIAYTPKQGDIVIFHPSLSETVREPNKDIAYVKRVIALEGQVVDIRDGDVYVDGELVEEDYILETIKVTVPNTMVFPYEVPKDTVFVLGDNRNNSHDSRSKDVGAVPLDNIIGKAEFRLFPFSNIGGLYK